MMNRQKYKQRRKVAGDSFSSKSIGQSTNIMKSTTATNHQGSKFVDLMYLANDPEATVRKVEHFINSETNNSEPAMKGIYINFKNLGNLNIKANHAREETKSELISEMSNDMYKNRSATCDLDETQFNKTDLSQLDLEEQIQSNGVNSVQVPPSEGSY